MKPRLVMPLFVVGLLALGAVVAGCGDGDDEVTREEGDGQVAVAEGEGKLSLEGYFQQLKAVGDDVTARFDALDDKFPLALEEPAATRDWLKETDPLFEDALDRFDDIDPPDQVRQAHNDFRDGVATQREVFRGAARDVADIQSTSELQQVVQARGAELDAVFARINAACLALQAIADDNAIVVDLECEEE